MDVFQTVADLESAVPPSEPWFAYCVATNLFYTYHSNPASSFGVLPADNNFDFLSTGNGGNTRWIAYEASGTYQPTFTAGTNIASNPTTLDSYYSRRGRFVHVFTVPTVDPTSAATASEFTISLPYVPSANFADGTQASGFGHNRLWGANTANAWSSGSLISTSGAKTVTMFFTPDDATARAMSINFQFWLL